MKRAAYHNLGCKVNSYELEAVIDLLKKDNYKIVGFDEFADVYIVNTCSVTNIADRKSRQMINRARKRNPEAVVVAMGCFVQSISDEERNKINADIVIGNNRKQNIIEDINQYFLDKASANDERKLIDLENINDGKKDYENLILDSVPSHTRAFIKIQDGCNEFCSYCIIPYARGRVRSRNFDDVINEISLLASKGCKEFVLTGIHVSSYCDETSGGNLYLIDLIESINTIHGVERIRLSSLEPRIITRDFLERLSKVDKICPHFHLSLQSGSDSVLKRMNRKYTTEEYYDRCVLLREYFSEPAITTDVIVGFPGETEEEFEETYDFLSKVHFFEMHVFKYSRRKGTRADRMEGQVDEKIKTIRSNKLIELDNKMSNEYRRGFIGKKIKALMEEEVTIDNTKYFQGYTREYVRVLVQSEDDLSNTFIKGVGSKVYNNYLLVEKIS